MIVTRIGLESGIIILVKIPNTPRPSTLPASSNSFGRPAKKVFIRITLKALIAPGMTMAQMVSRMFKVLATRM
ncbi:hypothetical protein D3C73_1194880 [compost metagenome]